MCIVPRIPLQVNYFFADFFLFSRENAGKTAKLLRDPRACLPPVPHRHFLSLSLSSAKNREHGLQFGGNPSILVDNRLRLLAAEKGFSPVVRSAVIHPKEEEE